MTRRLILTAVFSVFVFIGVRSVAIDYALRRAVDAQIDRDAAARKHAVEAGDLNEVIRLSQSALVGVPTSSLRPAAEQSALNWALGSAALVWLVFACTLKLPENESVPAQGDGQSGSR